MNQITKTHEAIPFKDGYVVVDKEVKPKADDWYIDDANKVRKAVISDKDYWAARPDYYLVIGSIKEVIEGVPLIEILGEAEEYWDKVYRGKREPYFIAGYKANPKQFTEEDMRNAMQILSLCINKDELNGFNIDWIKAEENLQLYIKSIQTKTIKSVELEMEQYSLDGREHLAFREGIRPKVHNPKENTIIPVKVNY